MNTYNFKIAYKAIDKATGIVVKENSGVLSIAARTDDERQAAWIARKKVKKQALDFMTEQWVKNVAKKYGVGVEVIRSMMKDGTIPQPTLWSVRVNARLLAVH